MHVDFCFRGNPSFFPATAGSFNSSDDIPRLLIMRYCSIINKRFHVPPVYCPSTLGVGDGPICALSVEYHMQRFGYIRSRSYMLHLCVFDAGPNKHDNLLGLSLPR